MDANVRTTLALGIAQSDVLIRNAIIAALADLRAKPYLLDKVFASLAQDSLTSASYGEKEIDKAKEWFLKTNIPVFMVPRIDEGKVPCISISLVSSEESEVTLGDVHWDVTEDNAFAWPALTPKFTVEGYDPTSGVLILPASIVAQVNVQPGMFIIDSVGGVHEILDYPILVNEPSESELQLALPFELKNEGDVTGDNQFLRNAVLIEPGLNVDFAQTVIKGPNPAYVTHLESVWYRENYQIGVHVSSEPVYLTWLHSIVVFALLRYKQNYLEARGFERSVFSSSDFARSDFNEGENVFSRYISITGNVRHYWPKETVRKVTDLQSTIRVIDADHLPPDTDPNDAVWIGDLDTIGTPKT